jgi:hypothetical protein
MTDLLPGAICEHVFERLYSGSYPDGAVITTELCRVCGKIELHVVHSGAQNYSTLYLQQPQAQEMAYALLKGCNRFAHIIEHRLMDEAAAAKKAQS